MVCSGVAAPTRTDILGLYRSLLRVAREFPDYNIREYTKRRTIDGFRENKDLTDSESISSAYREGKSQLAVAKRQSLVYSLYAPNVKSVMELDTTSI
ncbi:LYR motif-containing protein 4 [Mangifera indica]|uniref:LYR motif-containing protein 4 n=1 Tax=Mangifera indica TaxID=29780 RepID=UPI001CF952EA|nr:LYR motif-containing protein 4 [Mangifera indica]